MVSNCGVAGSGSAGAHSRLKGDRSDRRTHTNGRRGHDTTYEIEFTNLGNTTVCHPEWVDD